MNKNLKRLYIKLRLNDWGIWEQSEQSINHLNYKSFMAQLVKESTPISSLTLCDFECEQVSIIMSRLKHSHPIHYEVGHLYFVKNMGAEDLSKKSGTSQQTVYDRLNRLYIIVDEALTLLDQQESLVLKPSLVERKLSL